MRRPILGTRVFMLACLSALATAVILPGAAIAASPPITFGVSMGWPGGHITVLTAANAPTSVQLRDSDGNVKASGVLAADEIFFGLPADVSVEIGDRIKASDGTYTRTFVVPNLSITVDRVTDTFQGTGPAQRTIKIGWGGRFGDVFQDYGVRVRADGTWSLDAPFDVGGGQGISVWWKTPNGDTVDTGGSAAVLIVTLGSARFFGGTSEPFADVEVEIDGEFDGNWTGQSGDFGGFSGRFRRPNGNLIPVEVGDRISAPSVAQDLDWVVPDVQISADATTEIVTGHCGGQIAFVELYRTGQQRGAALVNPGDNNEFEFDFSDPMASDYVTGIAANEANVKHGDSLRIECILETGDSVLFRTTVP